MGTDSRTATGVNYLELTFAVFGGATAWLLRLVLNSSLVAWSCDTGTTWPLWATTAATTVIAVLSLFSSLRYRRLAGDAAHHDTARWFGFLGILFNVTAITGILVETAPALVLDLCRSVSGA